MYWLSYIILFFVQPLETAEQEKMAALIVKVNPDSAFIARPLVRAIYREAEDRGLDPSVFVAIAWAESWFRVSVRGKDWEKGVWQIWPWGSGLNDSWHNLRMKKRIKKFRDVPWSAMTLKEKWKATMDIDIGTYLAADLIQTFVNYCIARKHDRRRPTDSYAHYNSGYRQPRPGYSYQLWDRTKLIRKKIGRFELTEEDNRFFNRIVYTRQVKK